MKSIGRIHIYCGDGKGKTTAAAGLCTRALGAGLSVFFAQFIKDGSSSEIRFFEHSGMSTFQFFSSARGVFITGTPDPEDCARAAETMQVLREKADSGSFDLVIADEIFSAVNAGLISGEDVVSLMTSKAVGTELILTGRNPPASCVKLADLVSEIQCKKHYFNDGQSARKGIEF